MTRNTVEKGKIAEDMAVAYLEGKGLVILDRNYRFMKSELDIVAVHDTEIVFIEVRSQFDAKHGFPEESITDAKKASIYFGAEAWLHERRMEGARIRFDVVSILKSGADGEPEITHFRNAFWG